MHASCDTHLSARVMLSAHSLLKPPGHGIARSMQRAAGVAPTRPAAPSRPKSPSATAVFTPSLRPAQSQNLNVAPPPSNAAPQHRRQPSDGSAVPEEPPSLMAVEQVFRAEYPRLLEALASCGGPPAPTTALLLRRLGTDRHPGLSGASAGRSLVSVSPDLLPLLEHATARCNEALLAGDVRGAAAVGRASLCLLACLRFGSPAAAALYRAAATRAKQALKAAYDAGAPVEERHITELQSACAAASRFLWLTPYFGHRFAGAVDDAVAAGWASGEAAVRYTEAWASLTGQGRFGHMPDKYVRLVRAALRHPLSLDQLRRLQACTRRLPVDMSIALQLNARSEPTDCWDRQLSERVRHAAAAAPTNEVVPAGAVGRAARGAAAWQRVHA